MKESVRKMIWNVFLPLLFGAGITWACSYIYYVKAGEELQLEANRLREEASEINRMTNMILRGLHNSRIIEVVWKEWKPVGLHIKLQTKAEATTSASKPILDIDSK